MSDDKTVRISPRAWDQTGTTQKYHTRNCQCVTDDYREVSKDHVERRGFELCKFCDPDAETTKSGPNERRSLRWAIANGEVSL